MRTKKYVSIQKSKHIMKKSKPPPKFTAKKKKIEKSFKSDVKKLKKTEPLFYKALQSSNQELDLDTSLEEKSEDLNIGGDIMKKFDSEDSSDYEDEVSIDDSGDEDEVSDNNANKDEVEDTDEDEVSSDNNEEEDEDDMDENEVSSDDNEDEDEDAHEDEEVEEEEDYANEEEAPDSLDGLITSSMIEKWAVQLSRKETSIQALKCVQHALGAALDSISEKKRQNSRYILKGSELFNAVVCLCLKNVPPALYKLFDVKCLSDRPVKNKRWKRLAGTLRNYLGEFALLIASISDPNALVALLKKGVLALMPFYVEFPVISWRLTRHLANLWCTSDEKVRVLSLVALFRVMKSFKEGKRDQTLKLLYISYVSNCRFTSPSTWPVIDFMRNSLAELYSTDEVLAYRHSFVYIRQLAVHLRNAMLESKQERLQLVYNWQFVHSLHLWSDLLVRTHPSAILQPMIYPLTQVANGVITLRKASKYFPLVFHICDILTELASKTNTFIPIIPYLLEILTSSHILTTGKKKRISKAIPWDCAIKMTESQMKETAFSEGLSDQVFGCLLRYLSTQCCSIAFPELVIPVNIQLRKFKKKCKIPDSTKKMSQLFVKIKENSEFIQDRRRKATFSVVDTEAIKKWEIEVEQSSPPLRKFYLQWKGLIDDMKQRDKEAERMEQMEREAERADKFSCRAVRKRQREEADEYMDDETDESLDDETEESLNDVEEELADRIGHKKQKFKGTKKGKM